MPITVAGERARRPTAAIACEARSAAFDRATDGGRTRRLAHLEEADADVRKDEHADWKTFEVRGTYLSRNSELRSGPLDVYGTARWYKKDAWYKPDHIDAVEVQLRDHSQLFSAENLRFNRMGATFEEALERVFVDLCKTYPEGKLALIAQEMTVDRSGATALGRALGFELATTSPWKRLEGEVWSPVAQGILNASAILLAIFQPELAPLVFAVMATDNIVPDVEELVTRSANHTLTFSRMSITLSDIGLNLLPFAKGAQLVQSSAGAMVAIDFAAHGGMVAMIAVTTHQALLDIQEHDIAALADEYRELVALEKSVNPSDPDLARRRAAIAKGARAVRERTSEVWKDAILQNGAFLAVGHMLGRAGHAIGGAFEPARNHAAPHPIDASAHPIAAAEKPAAHVATSGAEPHRAQPEHDQGAEELRGATLEVTAAAVPGSTFRGKGSTPVERSRLLADASAALDEIVSQHREVTGVESARAGTADHERGSTHVVHLADNSTITIRVTVGALEGQTVARSIMNPTKEGVTTLAAGHDVDVHGRYVIMVSDKMDAANVRRAIAHEVAEILARRELVLRNELPGHDTLQVGGPADSPLTPHDRGRIAEINELAREASSDHGTRVQDELAALVEDMGLREGVEGADARFAKMALELSSEAREQLQAARGHESRLGEAEGSRR